MHRNEKYKRVEKLNHLRHKPLIILGKIASLDSVFLHFAFSIRELHIFIIIKHKKTSLQKNIIANG